jgi:mono/diheme cytochrome c family protein
LLALGVATAQEDADLVLGEATYAAKCAACHQVDGSGIPGTFPPLLENPSILDTEYLRSVIVNGLEGEIEVLGQVYDSSMISFPNLAPDELTALVAYIQQTWSPPAPAAETTTTIASPTGDGDADATPPSDREVAAGRLVYEANCSACHEADGSGRAGAFPPLIDNPNVQDVEYVRTVVRNGLSGEIEVLGEAYNGVMPGFSLLDDDQVTALIAFLQEGLGVPLPPSPPSPDAGGTAGTSLPSGAVLTYGIGFLIVLVAAGIVLTPIALARADGGSFTTLQTWLKASLIFLYFTLATVFIPSRVVESEVLASPPSVWGDLISDDLWDIIRSLIGTGVWLVALGLGVWGLRRIQQSRVI